MHKQNAAPTPGENKIEELLGKIRPVPSEAFQERMKQAAWHTENPRAQARSANAQRARLVLAMTVLLLVAGLLITPQGRAWAQEVFQFFKKINSTTVEMPDSVSKLLQETNEEYDLPLVPVFIPTVSPEMASLPGCETPQKSQSYHCQITLAESQLGFDLKELPPELEQWNFDFLAFNAAAKTATISYTLKSLHYGTLNLSQGAGDFPDDYPKNPWEAVPADKVQIVKVGTYNGEYVRGSFIMPAGSANLTWEDSDSHQRLAWSDGTKWYVIEVWSEPTGPKIMDRDQFIKLAESLVDSGGEKIETLDPNDLYSTLSSISDAEQISGLDLKAPTLLPMEVNFSYARYYSYNKEVHLSYGVNNELVIYEWKDKSIDLDKIADSPTRAYKKVTVSGKKALYTSVEEGSSPYLFLWWQNDGLNYQLYYYQYFGGKIDKEKMMAIAESLQDINDFHKKESRPYEYLSIYEQALGLKAREFQETPTGWSFAGVWPEPHGRCITLGYRTIAAPGNLVINECLTSRYFNVSDIPSNRIQPVRVGNSRGIYAAGGFVTGSDGQLTWDPDLPIQQLYWQEDGLWMQVSVYGGNALVYDKEKLISLAESLR